MTPRKKFDLSQLPERPDLEYEQKLWQKGLKFVAGIDEAGRGALAGPVAAGVVILPSNVPDLFTRLAGVRDSKLMPIKDREYWAGMIKDIAVDWQVGFASSTEIDRIGIVPATILAIKRAMDGLRCSLEHLLVDYLSLPDVDISQTSLVKGDGRSLSIASAAILAKTSRDALMVKMDQELPGYQFSRNKGYATQGHRQAITDLGPCKQHRNTFSPISAYFSLFPPNKTAKDP